jgi:hypothetical protein
MSEVVLPMPINLLDQLRAAIRIKHNSYSTEKTKKNSLTMLPASLSESPLPHIFPNLQPSTP